MRNTGWIERALRVGKRMSLSGVGVLFGGLIVAGALLPLPAQAQAGTSTPYCYRGSQNFCFDTLEKAEQKLRTTVAVDVDPTMWEPVRVAGLRDGEITVNYGIKNQPAATLYTPSYLPGSTPGIAPGGGNCRRSGDPNLPSSACAEEAESAQAIHQAYVAVNPNCTSGGYVQTSVRAEPYAMIDGNLMFGTYGVVNYGTSAYRSTFVCPTTGSKTIEWSVSKAASFTCPGGQFQRIHDAAYGDGVDDTTLPVLCRYTTTRTIEQPVKQVASCPANDNPCYPATGDKARIEVDANFAGRDFVRYYHSYREYRNNTGLGLGWTHTYTDRMTEFGLPNAKQPVVLSEAGYYESFVLVSGGQFRGQNNPDRRIDVINANGIGWRLREPDGEVREFDLTGQLVSVRHPDAPANDVALLYANGRLDRVVDAQGRSLRFVYDAQQRLSAVQLPDGRELQYGYDADRNLTSVRYPDNAVRTYLYGEAGLIGDPLQRNHLTGIVAEDGRRFASFKYDARGRVLESRVFSTPEDVTTVSYPSDAQAQVQTAHGDNRGYAIQPGLYRRILGVTDAAGASTREFDSAGRPTASVDRSGVRTEYGYAPGYRNAVVEAVGTPLQRRTETDRDATTHRVLERRTLDAAGAQIARTTWTYNSRGQVTATTAFDPVTGQARVATARYCEQADVTAGLCPYVGLLTAIDGPRSDVEDVVNYVYRQEDDPGCASTTRRICTYRKGDLWKVKRMLSAGANGAHLVDEILAYDDAGRPLRISDANGVITQLEYDARGRLTASKVRGVDDGIETDDRILRMSYWPTGQLNRMTQADGSILDHTYDAGQRLTAMWTGFPQGDRVEMVRNAAGQVTSEQMRDPYNTLHRTLSRSYDTLGRLSAIADADGQSTSFGYDANGELTGSTDALGRVASRGVDALRRERESRQDTAGINAGTQYDYNARDELTRVTDPKGLHTDYGYNGFGDVVQLNSPDTGVTTYAYDAAGNRIQQTDARGVTAQYAYDALRRLTSVSYPSDSTRNVAYVYDTAQSDCAATEAFLAGRLSRMTDASGSTTYCYNRFGDLTRKVQRTNGRVLVLRWEYASNGRLLRMIYPNGAETDYGYDAQGRVTEIGIKLTPTTMRHVVLSQATYAPFGPVTGWVYGAGLAMRRPVDLNYRPQAVEVVHTDTAGVQTAVGLRLRYAFDAVGNLVRLEDSRNPGTVKRRFGYDGLDRLVNTRTADEVALRSYTYDATGNRTALTERIPVFGGGTTTYQTVNHSYTYPANSHRLTAVDGVSRSYDAAGNLTQIGDAATQGGPRQFGYDASNRMAQVGKPTQVDATYVYSGAGERVRKTAAGVETYSLHDAAGRWIGDYDGNGVPIQQVIWLGDLPVGLTMTVPASAGQTQQKLFHLQPDMLGTPRVAVDPYRGSKGTVVWTWDLEGEAFGNEPTQQDPDGDGVAFKLDMRFPGQRYDAATGLNYNYFRDYEPGIGGYVQSDPIGLAGGTGTYAYALSNALVWIDEDGLQAKPRPGPTAQTPRPVPRFIHPNIPAANDPSYGTWRRWGARIMGSAVVRSCASPQGALFTALMAVPGNLGQEASCSDDPFALRDECKQNRNSNCFSATPANISTVLSQSTMMSVQPSISASVVQAYVSQIEAGFPVSPIRVDGNLIVDGNHRYTAFLLCRMRPPVQDWTGPMSAPRYPVRSLRIDP